MVLQKKATRFTRELTTMQISDAKSHEECEFEERGCYDNQIKIRTCVCNNDGGCVALLCVIHCRVSGIAYTHSLFLSFALSNTIIWERSKLLVTGIHNSFRMWCAKKGDECNFWSLWGVTAVSQQHCGCFTCFAQILRNILNICTMFSGI